MTQDENQYLNADAVDRRTALEVAVELVDGVDNPHHFGHSVLDIADLFYAWLRSRESMTPARLVLTAGQVTDQPAGD